MTILNDLRRTEFDKVIKYFGREKNVLEIGGGNGWQANLIAQTGANVKSIDVSIPGDSEQAYFKVSSYDGHKIPFGDEVFDVVFSSNVLEHVAHLESILDEFKRVLKPGGLQIHILPTPTWRIATSLSHYVFIIKFVYKSFLRNSAVKVKPDVIDSEGVKRVLARRGFVHAIKRALWAGPHGEYPNSISELWYFSRRRWLGVFSVSSLQLVDSFPSELFYTGYTILPGLPFSARRLVSRFVGSSTYVYVLRKT